VGKTAAPWRAFEGTVVTNAAAADRNPAARMPESLRPGSSHFGAFLTPRHRVCLPPWLGTTGMKGSAGRPGLPYRFLR